MFLPNYAELADTDRIARAGRLRRLVHCVRVLGVRTGFRYWRIENWAIKDPSLVLAWANACDFEADRCASTAPKTSAAFRGWAAALRRSHATYTVNDLS
jgi:hypothetical protein